MAAVTQRNDGNKAMADAELAGESGSESKREERKGPERVDYRTPQVRKPGGPRFFAIYKKGHGYWTRMGTAIGTGLLGVLVSFELYSQIPTFLHGTQQHDKRVAFVVALVFLIAYSIIAYWFTNKPSTVEFLIATDSEMKKVKLDDAPGTDRIHEGGHRLHVHHRYLPFHVRPVVWVVFPPDRCA